MCVLCFVFFKNTHSHAYFVFSKNTHSHAYFLKKHKDKRENPPIFLFSHMDVVCEELSPLALKQWKKKESPFRKTTPIHAPRIKFEAMRISAEELASLDASQEALASSAATEERKAFTAQSRKPRARKAPTSEENVKKPHLSEPQPPIKAWKARQMFLSKK